MRSASSSRGRSPAARPSTRSLQLDGRLPADERGRLRAHLRECGECATLARRQRARRAALRSLGPLLPASLASWGGGGAAVGTGIAAKAAAVVAAGVVAAGAGHEVADAVDRPVAVARQEMAVATKASRRARDAASRPAARRPSAARSTRRPEDRPADDARARRARPHACRIPEADSCRHSRFEPGAGAHQTVATVVKPVQNALPVETPALPPVQLPQPPPLPPLPVQPPPLPEVPPLPKLP